MPSLSRFYTGANAGSPVYQGQAGLNALQSGLDNLLKAKQTELAYAKQEEKQMLDNLKIDPISVASRQVTQQQGDMMNGFEEKWINRMAQSKGKLTMRDKAEMQADMQEIQSWQQGKLADYNEYLQATQMYSRNPDAFDSTQYANATMNYLATGSRPQEGYLSASATPYDDYIKGMEFVALGGKTKTAESPNFKFAGQGNNERRWSPILSEQDARQLHYGYVTGSPRNVKRLEENWRILPQWKKDEIISQVDQDNNGLDELERRNAIIEADWQQNKGRFLNPRTVPYTEPKWYDEQHQPEVTIDATINGGGVSPDKTGYGWYPGENGIELKYKSTSPKDRGLWIEQDKIGGVPKNATVSSDGLVYVYPRRIDKNGKVVLGVMTGTMEKIPDKEQEDMLRLWEWDDAPKDVMVDKGVAYRLKKSTGFSQKVEGNYNDMKDFLGANFGAKLNEAWDYMVKNKGWGVPAQPSNNDYSKYGGQVRSAQ